MQINLIEFKPSKYNMKYMKGMFKLSGTDLPSEVQELYNELLFDEELIVKYQLNQRDIELLNYLIAYKGNVIVLSDNKNFIKANTAYIEHNLSMDENYKNIICHTGEYDFSKYPIPNQEVSHTDYIDENAIGFYNISNNQIDSSIPMITCPKMLMDMTYFLSNPISFDSDINTLYYGRVVVNVLRANLRNIMTPDLLELYNSILPVNFDLRVSYYSTEHNCGHQIINEYSSNPDPDTLLGLGVFVY